MLVHCLVGSVPVRLAIRQLTLLLSAQALGKLAAACGVAGPKQLAAAHAAQLMVSMLQRSDQWHSSHPDLPSFTALLHTCPGITLAALGQPLCLALGAITKDHDRDSRLRSALLRAVDSLLEDGEQGSCLCREHGLLLLTMVLLPPLVWRAGAAIWLSMNLAIQTLGLTAGVGS
jgi:hypothetical protein